jgi:hypothetical protein
MRLEPKLARASDEKVPGGRSLKADWDSLEKNHAYSFVLYGGGWGHNQ